MKWITTVIITHLCLTAFGDEGYRSFTDQQGRIIKAKLISFDSKSGKVTIERDNRHKATVPPNIFSSGDQAYIKQWMKVFLLSDKSNFVIGIDENEGELSDFKNIDPNGTPKKRLTRIQEHSYVIDINNKADVDFGKVRLVHCAFIERKGYGTVGDAMYCEIGTTIGELKPTTTSTFKTDDVKTFHRYREFEEGDTTVGYDIYKKKDAIEKIQGVLFRVYMDGNTEIFLEFSEPGNFIKKYHWKEFRAREGKEKSGLEK